MIEAIAMNDAYPTTETEVEAEKEMTNGTEIPKASLKSTSLNCTEIPEKVT